MLLPASWLFFKAALGTMLSMSRRIFDIHCGWLGRFPVKARGYQRVIPR